MSRTLAIALIVLCSPNASADQLDTIRSLIDADRFREAKTRLEGVKPAAADGARFARLEAASALGLGLLNEARRWIERSLSLEKDNAEGHLILARCAAAESQRAGALSKLRLAREVRTELETAISLDPSLVEARVDLVRFHSTAIAVAGGRVEEARRQADTLERLDRPAAAFARGYIAYRARDYREAEREFKAAIDLDPSRREPRLWAAYLFMETEQFDRAFAVLEPIRETHPGYAPVWFELGRTAAYSTSRLEEGEEWLKRYLTVTPMLGWPSHARAWAFLGLLRERDARPAEARVAWERALRLDPNVEEATEGIARLE